MLGDSGNDLVQSGDIASDITPLFSIDVQASVTEGSAGTTSVVVNVQLQQTFSTSVSVDFTTTDGTATLADNDYVAASDTLTFAPGVTTQSISVDVVGDMVSETDEFFTVDLSNAVGGVIVSGQAQVVIVNDDLWIPTGPSATINGQVENVSPNDEVSGALHAVVAHPTDPNILYAAGTNGGVWRTLNAQAASPNWEPLTDNLSAQSIGALELDPADPDTIIAGIGRFSSFAQAGSNLTGIIVSRDGGDSFQEITDPLITGENVSAVQIRGNVLLAASNGGSFGNVSPFGGLFRSTDGGSTWNEVTGSGGLPTGNVLDMTADPGNTNRLYLSMAGIGVFRSDDLGVTWTNISINDTSGNGVNATITTAGNNNAELTVGPTGTLFAGVIINGQPQYIGFTTDQGATWSRMDLPLTPEAGGVNEGLSPRVKPGSQGGIHFSILADPNNPNLVYVGGDRQAGDLFGPNGNFLGARNFTAACFVAISRLTRMASHHPISGIT